MTIKTKLFLILVVLLVVIGAAGSLIIMRENAARKVLEREAPLALQNVVNASYLNTLAQQILYYDEVLTQSARNYAFTGDPEWKDRYNNAVTKLATTIDEAISLGTAADGERFRNISQANDSLVAMEVDSFARVEAGDAAGAQSILGSDAYAAQKSVYQSTLAEYLSAQNLEANREVADAAAAVTRTIKDVENSLNSNRQLLEGFMSLVAVLFLMLMAVVFRRVIFPIAAINRAATLIAKGNLRQNVRVKNMKDEVGRLAQSFNVMSESLRQSYRQLESKVTERTQDLAKYKLAVEQANEHIVITDSDGVILYGNRSAELITGFSLKDMLGRTPALWGKQMPLEFYKKFWKQIKDQKKAFSGEFTNKRKNGELYTADARVAPILNERGKVQFYVGIERDVTKEREIERMKSDFVSLVSHQLKTPVAIVRGDVENLLSGLLGPLTKKQRAYLEDIRKTSIRNYNLISDLLNVSRIERGVIKVDIAPTRLTEVYDAVIHDYRQAAEEKKLKLTVEPFDESLLVMADREKFIQSLANVVNNALKYTTKGGISIATSTSPKAVAIEVTDTGKGMDVATMQKLFSRDLVMSVDPSPDHSSGLGLYIAKNFMLLQRGDVTVRSSVGKGSTFTFTIPIAPKR